MPSQKDRLHALDNLRALLALLGIPFHVLILFMNSAHALGYSNMDFAHIISSVPKEDGFIFCCAFYVHAFRMPVFFLLAGFFAHLLYEKVGSKHFFKNRFVRIGVPFLFFMLWLLPSYLNHALFLAAQKQYLHQQAFQDAFYQVLKGQYIDGTIWQFLNNTRDTWFLYDLLWFYLLTVILVSSKKAIAPLHDIAIWFDKSLEKIFLSAWCYLWMPCLCACLLIINGSWYAVLDTGLVPSISLLLFYSLWYFLGWWLWLHKSLIVNLSRYPLLSLGLSIFIYAFYLTIYFHYVKMDPLAMHWLAVLLYGVSMTLAVFALLSLAWRYLAKAQRLLKCISEASYWIYLMQLPLLMIIMPILQVYQFGFYTQFFLGSGICILICVISYHAIIRHTWVGRIIG